MLKATHNMVQTHVIGAILQDILVSTPEPEVQGVVQRLAQIPMRKQTTTNRGAKEIVNRLHYHLG